MAELEILSATLLRLSGACGPEAERFTYEERHQRRLVGEEERRLQQPAAAVVRQTRLGVVLRTC